MRKHAEAREKCGNTRKQKTGERPFFACVCRIVAFGFGEW